jgi:glycogen synthase
VRIALFPSSFAPAVGGVEVLTASLAKQLAGRGHEVEIWTGRSHDDDRPRDEWIDGLRVRRFVFALPRANPRTLPHLARTGITTLADLRSAAKEFRPDVLHVQCFSGNGVYATALSTVSRIPLVITLQGETLMDDQDIYERSTTLRVGLRLALRHASAVTACSAFVLEDARSRFGLPPAKGLVIFNGVDGIETNGNEMSIPFQRYILGLGRVVQKKGFDLLIDAFSLVAQGRPEVGLVIAGDGAARGELESQAIRLGLRDRVLFTGSLRRAQVASVLSRADLLVVPSRLEPFGIVALEAWHAGVPLVMSSRGGASEFVEDGVSARLVDPYDSRQLSQAIESLLDSRDLRRELIRSGRQEVAKFGWSTLTSQYEREYERVVVPVIAQC